MGLHPVRVAVRERVGGGAPELLDDVLLSILLGYSGLSLDDLCQRPECHSVAVGQASSLAPGDELGISLDDALQLVHESALADARYSHEREELRRARMARPVEGILDDRQLASASDELGTRLVATSTPKRERAASASQTGIGSAFPFASTGSAAR